MAPRGAHRGAHGDFSFARGGSSQKKVCDVSTGDQEQQKNGGKQSVEGVLEPSNQAVQQRLRNNGKFFGENPLGVFFLQTVGNVIEIRTRSFQGDSRLKTPHKRRTAIERWSARVRTRGHIKCRSKRIELAGHDSDEGSRHPVENEIRAEDFRVTTKFTLPEAVVHHENIRSIRLCVFLRERAAKISSDSQELKRISGNCRTGWPIASRLGIVKPKTHPFISGHVFEHMILFAKAANLGGREKVPSLPSTGIRQIANSKNNEFWGGLIGQGLKERVVDDAEDDGGSADAEGQSNDGSPCHAPILAEGADGVAAITGKAVKISVHGQTLHRCGREL